MKNLPSINVTYQRVLDLIRQSCIAVFPIALAYAIGQYSINKLLPFSLVITPSTILNIVFQMVYASLFFCLAMEVVYQRYYQLPLDYLNIIRKSIERCGPFLLSMLLLFLPTLIMVVVLLLTIIFLKVPPQGEFMNSAYEFTVLVIIGNLVGFVFAFVSPVFIINQKKGVIEGIKQSYQLVKEFWITTFLLLFILGIVIWLLSWLFTLLVGGGILTQSIVGFFILPLSPALMVVHCYHLQNPNQ